MGPRGPLTPGLIAWTLAIAMVLAWTAHQLLAAANGRLVFDGNTTALALYLAMSVVGILIVSRHPANAIGWLFAIQPLFLIIGAGEGLAEQYVSYSLRTAPGSLPAPIAVALLKQPAWSIGFNSFAFLFLLFPNGRPPTPRWQLVGWFIVASIAFESLTAILRPGPLPLRLVEVANPLGLEALRAASQELIPTLVSVLDNIAFFGSIFSVAFRHRRAAGIERKQLQWFFYAVALFTGWFVLLSVNEQLRLVSAEALDPLLPLGVLSIPVAVGFAILRYRLYEIDLLINRTLVYGSLTAILAGLYTASIRLFQRLFTILTGEESDAAIVLTIFMLATVFTPLRARLQQTVDRRFGRAWDVETAMKAIADDTRRVLEVVDARRAERRLLGEAVAASGASGGALYLGDGQSARVETYGEWNGEVALEVPLRRDGVTIGRLALGPRRGGRAFDTREREAIQTAADLVAETVGLASSSGSR